jgi:hypothetical protein
MKQQTRVEQTPVEGPSVAPAARLARAPDANALPALLRQRRALMLTGSLLIWPIVRLPR